MTDAPLRHLFDVKLLKFLMVGVTNTLLSAVLMFGLYRLGGLGYWASSVISYVIGAAVSFWLNKAFTFKDHGTVVSSIIRFAATVAICYLFAFSLARPLVSAILAKSSVPQTTIDQIAMLVAMVLYTAANYLLQRTFVFRHQTTPMKDEQA